MNFDFTGIPVGVDVQCSTVAITAYGVIGTPPSGPDPEPGEPIIDESEIPLQSPLVVSTGPQYAAIFRFGQTPDATSYDMAWSFDQVNWTTVANVSDVHELSLVPNRDTARTLYARHRAIVDGVPGPWSATGNVSITRLTHPIQINAHPRGKRWRIGDRLSDHTVPEGLTITQMLDASNYTMLDGAQFVRAEFVQDSNVGDAKGMTRRFIGHDLITYMLRAYYRPVDATADKFVEYSCVVRLVAVEVWLDERQAQGTDSINILPTVPDSMVLSDFVHTINGTTYTTSGVTVGQLRAGPVAVTGAAGGTIGSVGTGLWATLGVAAGAEMTLYFGRQHVWVPVYGSNPGPRVKINMHRGSQNVEGEGIAASVYMWGFDTRQNWREVWDAPMQTLGIKWTVPGRANRTTAQKMRAVWRDGTKAYGPCPAFVVRTVGTFNLSVQVSERSSGKYATANASGTTISRSTAFPGAATICITGGGSTSGAPSGATIVTNWEQAVAALKANRSTRKQILFSAHVPHNMDHPTLSGLNTLGSGVPNCYIGSYGPGRAVLEQTAAAKQTAILTILPASLDLDGAVVRDLSFRGPWDPTTETGFPNKSGVIYERGGHLAILDCDAENLGVSYGSKAPEDTIPGVYVLSECVSNGHRDYALYCATGALCRVGITGNLLMQNVDAMQGGLGKDDTKPANQHFVRFQGSLTVYIEGNDLFTRGGWTNPIGGVPIDQAIRDHRNHPRSSSYIVHNVMEGGWGMMAGGSASPDQTGAGGFQHPTNRVIEANWLIASARTASILDGSACTTARGNLMIKPRVKSSPYSDTVRHFQIVTRIGSGIKGDTHIEAAKERTYMHHNTLIHLGDPETEPGMTAEKTNFFQVQGPNYRVTFSDNVVHMPNFPALGFTDFAPMEAVNEGLTPRMLGYKWRYEKASEGWYAILDMDTRFATPSDTMRIWRPAPGSAANIATGPILPPFDFDGNLAPGMPNGVGTVVPGTMWAGAIAPAA